MLRCRKMTVDFLKISCLLSHFPNSQHFLYFVIFRLVFNGNNDSSSNTVIGQQAAYHLKDGDIPINVDSPQTQLDTNGVLYSTTSGFTETELSGQTVIGPFQRGMKKSDASAMWVHLLRYVNYVCLPDTVCNFTSTKW